MHIEGTCPPLHGVLPSSRGNVRLDLGALLYAGLGHAAGDLAGVSLDAGDDGMAEGVRLAAGLDGLDDDDLLAGVAATGDEADSGLLQELHFVCDGDKGKLGQAYGRK